MIEPEDKTPWLRLARLSEDHEANKRLWNGYQKYLLKPYAGDYQRKLENPKFKEIAELQMQTFFTSKRKYKTSPRAQARLAKMTSRQTSKKSKCR